jgi:hypothetical protein
LGQQSGENRASEHRQFNACRYYIRYLFASGRNAAAKGAARCGTAPRAAPSALLHGCSDDFGNSPDHFNHYLRVDAGLFQSTRDIGGELHAFHFQYFTHFFLASVSSLK